MFDFSDIFKVFKNKCKNKLKFRIFKIKKKLKLLSETTKFSKKFEIPFGDSKIFKKKLKIPQFQNFQNLPLVTIAKPTIFVHIYQIISIGVCWALDDVCLMGGGRRAVLGVLVAGGGCGGSGGPKPS